MTTPPPEQRAVLREQVRSALPPEVTGPAQELPVAQVAVDVPHPHLDRPFDYLVPATLDEQVVPGSRVRLRFAGRKVDGFVLARQAVSEHDGRLGRVDTSVSAEQVLRPDVARLCRLVADRYAGTFADVVRLAVPPRHAREEKAAAVVTEPRPLPAPDLSVWQPFDGASEMVRSLADGASSRAVLSVVGGVDWVDLLVSAVVATLASGRGAVVCLPDARDVSRLDAALTATLGDGSHAVLTAALGPQARYRAFLALARGRVRVAVGTRAAAFAPVHDVGLLAMWDDGDDLFCEPRAPYPHAREVLMLRAHEAGAGLLLVAAGRSAEAQAVVESGWCRDLTVTPQRRRELAPAVRASDSDTTARRDPTGGSARIPTPAQQLIRASLESGPVLVSVARSGYRPALACQSCRTRAACRRCSGPLQQRSSSAAPQCSWCGTEVDVPWSCPVCKGTSLRAHVVGEQRTAEELGRALPGVVIRSSGGEHVLPTVDARRQVVVATPGAEPVAEGGFAAAVILDADLALSRPDLRTTEETFRRWSNVVALVRPGSAGGQVMVVGEARHPAVQALVRADPAGLAERELSDRQAARLPPAVRLATVSGPADEVARVAEQNWPQPRELLGPVSVDDGDARLIVRMPRSHARQLADALKTLSSTRSAHKLPVLRVQVDPYDLA
jgi:primosomal protein N' (replication factor Y)